jgi:hypothetical protein
VSHNIKAMRNGVHVGMFTLYDGAYATQMFGDLTLQCEPVSYNMTSNVTYTGPDPQVGSALLSINGTLNLMRELLEKMPTREGPERLDQLIGELLAERDWLRARNEALVEALRQRDLGG